MLFRPLQQPFPPLHSVRVQAISSWDAATGIEQARYSCGGNGFLQSSGLPRLLTYYLQNVTWDGENSVMALQTARHLVKCVAVRDPDARRRIARLHSQLSFDLLVLN